MSPDFHYFAMYLERIADAPDGLSKEVREFPFCLIHAAREELDRDVPGIHVPCRRRMSPTDFD